MDIEAISFVFAMLLGVICFGLVKYTADEFDHCYDETFTAKLRIPTAVTIILGIIVFQLI